MSAALVDTNVLAYSVDAGSPARHAQATELLANLGKERFRVSTQVLSELANVMVHPRKLAMPPMASAEAIETVVGLCEVLAVDTAVVLAALHARDSWQLEYYDAQIWATAALHNVPVVLSEDFSSGTTLGGVTFIDPFADDFDLESL